MGILLSLFIIFIFVKFILKILEVAASCLWIFIKLIFYVVVIAIGCGLLSLIC